MTPTPMARLADARPEVSRRPHTVVSPADRAALLRSITGSTPTVSPYVEVDEDEAIELVDLRGSRHRRPRPLLLAAAAGLVVAAIGAGLVVRSDDGTSTAPPATDPPVTTVLPPGSEASQFPRGFNFQTAEAVFRAPGDVNAVLDAYIADRYDAAALPEAHVTDQVGDLATARWTFGNDTEGTLATGLVLFRRDDGGWAVTASTIQGVDVSTVGFDGNRVTGTVSGPDVRGQLSVSTTDDPFEFTSTDPRVQEIELDIPTTEPVLLHIQVTGGATLGVAEYIPDVPVSDDPTLATLPAGFDPATASAVFTADGDINAVLDEYVADRWNPPGLPTVSITEDRGDRATAVWDMGGGGGGTSGTILLRQAGPDRWSVVASTIDGLAAPEVHNTGGRVTGAVLRDGQDGALIIDLLDSAGQPVIDPIHDDLQQRRNSIPLDAAVDGPVVLQTRILGGTVLGVGEVALDPPTVVTEGVGGSTIGVQRRFGETCAGLGSSPGLGSGAGWVCRSDDETWPDDVWYLQLGPTSRLDFQVLVTGLVHPSVASIQVRRADRTEVDASTSRVAAGDGAYVVAAVPLVEGPVFVDLLDGDGAVLDTVELAGLLPTGG